MRVNEWIELYQKATRGEATYGELVKLANGTVFGEIAFDCYDIVLIREGFARYERGEVDEKYFRKWCFVYSRAIFLGHKILVREEMAYSVISDILEEVSKNIKTLQDALQEIEYHNDILEGRREAMGVGYTLAGDLEQFYVERDDDGRRVDLILFNHYQKTYAVYRDEDSLSMDGFDMMDRSFESIPVSRVIFEVLCKAAATTGYQEKDKV